MQLRKRGNVCRTFLAKHSRAMGPLLTSFEGTHVAGELPGPLSMSSSMPSNQNTQTLVFARSRLPAAASPERIPCVHGLLQGDRIGNPRHDFCGLSSAQIQRRRWRLRCTLSTATDADVEQLL